MSVVYRFGHFELDCRMRELRRNGQPVAMPARCFECMRYLLAQRDRAVSRDELSLAVFGRRDVSDAQLGQVVLRTRRAIEDDGHNQRAIRTAPRFGFRWIAETSEAAPPPTPVDEQTPIMTAGSGSKQRRRLWQASAATAVLAAAVAWLLLATLGPAPPTHAEQALLEARQDFAAGRYRPGLAKLDHLIDSLSMKGDTRLHGRALIQRARIEVRMGRHVDAERDFSAAIDLIDARRDPGLLGQARNGRAVARMELRKFHAARDDLKKARELLTASGDLRSLAWVDANLAYLHRRLAGTSERPAPGSISEADTFTGDGLPDPEAPGLTSDTRAAAHIELAAFYGDRLEWQHAYHHAASAWTLREKVTSAARREALTLAFAQALLGNGRLVEAQALLRACGDGLVRTCGDRRVDLLWTELAWRSGDAWAALAFAERALADRGLHAKPALLRRLQRMRLQIGISADVPVRHERFEPTESEDTVDAWLIRALAAQTAGLHHKSRSAYRQALSRALDGGAPAEVLTVARTYVPWLMARGEVTEALELAARLSSSSVHDYDAALLQADLLYRIGELPSALDAAQHAQALAGERPLPAAPKTQPDAANDAESSPGRPRQVRLRASLLTSSGAETWLPREP